MIFHEPSYFIKFRALGKAIVATHLFHLRSFSLFAPVILFLVRASASFVFRDLRIGEQRAGADDFAARVAFFGEEFVGGFAFFDPADESFNEAGGPRARSVEA